MVARGKMGEGDGIVREFGMDMYALLHLKWVTKKDLLDTTWNAAQCSTAAWVRGVFGLRMESCMAESLHCPTEVITA